MSYNLAKLAILLRELLLTCCSILWSRMCVEAMVQRWIFVKYILVCGVYYFNTKTNRFTDIFLDSLAFRSKAGFLFTKSSRPLPRKIVLPACNSPVILVLPLLIKKITDLIKATDDDDATDHTRRPQNFSI